MASLPPMEPQVQVSMQKLIDAADYLPLGAPQNQAVAEDTEEVRQASQSLLEASTSPPLALEHP
jgi:hypothetical protein